MKNTNKLLVVLLAVTIALSGIVATLTTSARELDADLYAFYEGSDCYVNFDGHDNENYRDYEAGTYNLDYYERDLYAPFDNEYAELEEGGVYKAIYWLTINYINNFNDTKGWEVKFMPTEEYYMNITNADIWNQEGPTSVAVVVPFKVTDINNVKLKMWSHGALIDGSCVEGIAIVGADYNVYDWLDFDIVVERVANAGSNVENNKPADDEWTPSDPDAVDDGDDMDIPDDTDDTDDAEITEGILAMHFRPQLADGGYTGGEDDGVLVEDFYGAYCGYDNVKQFDDSIDGLLEKSFVRETVDVTDVNAGNQDNYIMKWTGTMTAAESGTYTLIGRKIDNGFVMFVNGEKVYEYWGASHWFDGASDRLVSDEGSFDVVADRSYEVEIYFLELGGGDALEIWATTTPDNTDSGANINDVFDFELTRETYWLADSGHWNDYANDVLVGSPTGEGNGGQCSEETALFYESIEGLLDAFNLVDMEVVSSFKEPVEAYEGDAAYVIVYMGIMVPNQSGEYTFGADVIDNGFYLELASYEDLLADPENTEYTTAYEFWVGRRWNDDGSGNTYGQSVTLEAGKEYVFAAAFLETNGGQALELVASVDGGERTSVDELFTFYSDTQLEEDDGTGDDNTGDDNTGDDNTGDATTDKPVTGDVAMLTAVLAAGVAGLGGLKLRKKSK